MLNAEPLSQYDMELCALVKQHIRNGLPAARAISGLVELAAALKIGPHSDPEEAEKLSEQLAEKLAACINSCGNSTESEQL